MIANPQHPNGRDGRSPDWRTLAAALTSLCLWSSAFVGIRAASRELSAGSLALGRLLIGTALLGLLVAREGVTRPTPRHAGLLAVAGLLWFGAYNLTLNTAERTLDAGTAAMIINITPLLVMLLAGLFLRERLTPALLLGGAIACFGVTIIGLSGGLRSASLWGVLTCVMATLAAAGGLVAQKAVLSRLSALQVTWTCCAIGAASCLPFAPSLVRDVRHASPTAIAWMGYLGIMPTSVAFTSWAYALSRSSASRLAALVYLVPPLTIGLSWLTLGEVPRVAALAGGALCLAGVVVARSNPKPAAHVAAT
ncbi:MAG TPA: DMT family transporter [Gemmatimonadaceae bacterium]|nr:DMT family transporter [Gemmatimonadaceae bacterium]